MNTMDSLNVLTSFYLNVNKSKQKHKFKAVRFATKLKSLENYVFIDNTKPWCNLYVSPTTKVKNGYACCAFKYDETTISIQVREDYFNDIINNNHIESNCIEDKFKFVLLDKEWVPVNVNTKIINITNALLYNNALVFPKIFEEGKYYKTPANKCEKEMFLGYIHKRIEIKFDMNCEMFITPVNNTYSVFAKTVHNKIVDNKLELKNVIPYFHSYLNMYNKTRKVIVDDSEDKICVDKISRDDIFLYLFDIIKNDSLQQKNKQTGVSVLFSCQWYLDLLFSSTDADFEMSDVYNIPEYLIDVILANLSICLENKSSLIYNNKTNNNLYSYSAQRKLFDFFLKIKNGTHGKN